MPIVLNLLADENLVGYLWDYVDRPLILSDPDNFYPGIGSKHYAGAFGLQVAAHFDLLEVATELIKLGANVDADPERFQTPLIVASKAGNPRFVRFLLENGANVNKVDDVGRPADFYAWVERARGMEIEPRYRSGERHGSVEVELRNHGASITNIGRGRYPDMSLHGSHMFQLYRTEKENHERLRAAREKQNKYTRSRRQTKKSS